MGHDTWIETTEEDREEWKQHLNMKNPKFAEDLLSNGGVNADIRTKLNVFNRYSIEWNFDFMETGGAEGYIDEIVSEVLGKQVTKQDLDYIEPAIVKKYTITRVNKKTGKIYTYSRVKAVKYEDEQINFLKMYINQIKDKSITAKEVANRFNRNFMQKGYLARNNNSIVNKIKIIKLRS